MNSGSGSLPRTIDMVIDRLDEIVESSRTENSRAGFFAALYRQVTIRVRDAIERGEFDDNERMERLDVLFANRYFAAYDAYQRGEKPSLVWQAAFDAARLWRPVFLQHLLLGMNAHINLDLAIAAAESAAGEDIEELEIDFMAINAILSDLLEVVQMKINHLSPAFGLLDRFGGRADEAIMNFSIRKARDEAWEFTQHLAGLEESEREETISDRDRRMKRLADLVLNPGWFVSTLAFVVRVFERKNVGETLDMLSSALNKVEGARETIWEI
jgi:hypothetical protein